MTTLNTNIVLGIKVAKKVFFGWIFWVLLLVIIISNIVVVYTVKSFTFETGFTFIVLPYLIIVFYIYSVRRKIRGEFWKKFAKVNKYHHKGFSDTDEDLGLIFTLGSTKETKNTIEGSFNGGKFSIFDFEIKTGGIISNTQFGGIVNNKYSWKNIGVMPESFYYTIFTFNVNNKFPHLYLNNLQSFNIKKFKFEAKMGGIKNIILDGKFESKFQLFSFGDIDDDIVLSIFNVEILNYLSNCSINYDIELIDNKMMLIIPKEINSFKELKNEFDNSITLKDKLYHPVIEITAK